MDFNSYSNVILNDERVDWYGEEIPIGLLTNKVRVWCEMVIHQITLIEMEISEIKTGKLKQRKKEYVDLLMLNVKRAPYVLNGDPLLTKKRKIEENTVKNKVKKTVKTKKETNTKTTKNSKLIFGK